MENLQSMGIGVLGAASTFFVRKFRWTIKSDVLQEHAVKRINFDFANNTMQIEAYEVVVDGKINIQDWVDSKLPDVLVFTTYDGCGVAIYSYEISDYLIVSDTSDFDYESSEVSTRNITVQYKHLKHIHHLNKQKQKELDFESKHKHIWKICMQSDYAVKSSETVVVKKRPTLKIEETEVNFLNSKTWIPGKTEWEPIDLEFNGRPSKMLSLLTSENVPMIKLILLDGTNQPLEQWSLFDAVLVNMSHADNITKVSLIFNRAEYLPNLVYNASRYEDTGDK